MEIIRKSFSIHGTPEQDVCVIAIGDIHGELELLERALKAAQKTVPSTAKRVDLVLLGDVIDRGKSSLAVLDLLRKGINGWNIYPLLGNHEQLLLIALDASDETYAMKLTLWRGNGGIATLGIDADDFPSTRDLDVTAHKEKLIQAIGPDRVDYLRSFSSHYRSDSLLCVHGGIDPKISLAENFAKDPLEQGIKHWAWIREDFLDYDSPFEENVFVVHGHTVIPGPKLEPHRIGLDTGACVNGVLSGATFFNNEMTVFQVTHN